MELVVFTTFLTARLSEMRSSALDLGPTTRRRVRPSRVVLATPVACFALLMLMLPPLDGIQTADMPRSLPSSGVLSISSRVRTAAIVVLTLA